MRRLLVIEDGTEYEEFARLFLAAELDVRAAHSAAEALTVIRSDGADAFLIDLRFDRAHPDALVGDVTATAARLFGGDRERALRHLQEQQGALILGALRSAGYAQRAVFVHDFSPRRLDNLRRLYGDVDAVASFDVPLLHAALRGRT